MKKILFVLFVSIFLFSCSKKAPEYKGTFIVKSTKTCPACVKAKPVVDELEKEYGKEIKFLRYELTDPEDRAAADKYETRMIPAFIILDSSGNIVFKHEGILSKKILEDQIEIVLE
ncbi:MAG: TlpA family protein disulfide reductase [Candidatus Goldiibacteriota bacterium]